jgi:hypothetical protein
MPFPFGDPNPNSGSAFPSGPPPYPFGMTYSGPTTISGGTLEVNKYLGVSPVAVSGTGTLRGVGVVGGTVDVASGGTIAPGTNIIGALAISNNVTFHAGAKGLFRVNLTAGTNDQLVGISTLTYGGTLAVNNLGTQAFADGNMLKLFDAATYVGNVGAIQPASPGPGLMWLVSNLPVNGTLQVVSTVTPVVSGAARRSDGNVGFTITGVPGQGYTVWSSTNVALPLANWSVLQSGWLPSASYNWTDLTSTNFPVRFYRVSNP